MTFAIIIPARYASTRFPGKPLAMLGSKPIIRHVYENVAKTGYPVYVATDDNRIAAAVESFGGKYVITRADHRSGTDRLCEAVENLKIDPDVIINVQGDEPFIHHSQIDVLTKCFTRYPNTDIATLARYFSANDDYETLKDPNKVKVVTDIENRALYFSRSVIPFLRGHNTSTWPKDFPYQLHVGVYAYRKSILSEICAMPPSSLEIAESLEQLRWLQNGYRIRVGITDRANIGIDTPADLEYAQKLLFD